MKKPYLYLNRIRTKKLKGNISDIKDKNVNGNVTTTTTYLNPGDETKYEEVTDTKGTDGTIIKKVII